MARRRRLWTLLIGCAVVGGLLGAMAAAMARDRASNDGEATARPAIVLSPPARSPTPRPAVAATVAPTDAQPTEPPPATAEANTPLATFLRHVGRAIKQGESLLTPLQKAAQALDVKAVRTSAAALSSWAATESAWLDHHPPASCYADVHHTYASAIDDFAQAATITEQFAKAFPFADYGALQRAQGLAESGSASMQGAVDRLSAVRC